MCNVFYDGVYCVGEVNFVFVVYGDVDEEFSFMSCMIDLLVEFVIFGDEVVWVVGDGCILYVCKFNFIVMREEVVEDGRDFVFEDEFVIDELDFVSGSLGCVNIVMFLSIVWGLVVLVGFFIVVVFFIIVRVLVKGDL